jgi:hypothetical protein
MYSLSIGVISTVFIVGLFSANMLPSFLFSNPAKDVNKRLTKRRKRRNGNNSKGKF